MKYRFLLNQNTFYLNVKKTILVEIKANILENPYRIAKNQEFELLTLRHFKNVISPKPQEQSLGVQLSRKYSDSVKCRYFVHISDFFKKSSKPGYGNLVLITSS